MECTTAIELISAALDREPVDAALLAEAKAHCTECGSCRAFVRTLLALQRTPAPAAPDGLVERVMASVRAEAPALTGTLPDPAAAVAAAPAATALHAPTAADEDPLAVAADLGIVRPDLTLAERIKGSDDADYSALRDWLFAPQRRRGLYAWSAAAAVLLVAIGFVTVAGVRGLLAPPASTSEVKEITTISDTAANQPARQSTDQAAYAGGSGAPTPAEATTVTVVPDYIVVNGSAYRRSGDANVDFTQVTPKGTTGTSLGTSDVPKMRTVYGGADANRVYVADDSNRLSAFDLVVRTYDGRQYKLQSIDITAFGGWPTMPATIPRPGSADGSPTFTPLGKDAGGVQVYRLNGGTAENGIAVGPDTPSTDPAAGNPGWTWWTPL